MNPSERIIITIEPEQGTVRIDSFQNGVSSSKLVDYEGITECFSSSIRHKEIGSGLLPPNCLSYSRNGDKRSSVTLLFPERRADFIYHDTIYAQLPLPRLVFRFFVYQGQRVESVWMGVAEEGRITPKTKMFRYPFSNVSGYRLCTGVNALPKYDSLHGISTLPYLILSMPNNDDYFKAENNRQKMELRTLLEHLKDKDPSYYYSDVLIPNGQTISDFIK